MAAALLRICITLSRVRQRHYTGKRFTVSEKLKSTSRLIIPRTRLRTTALATPRATYTWSRCALAKLAEHHWLNTPQVLVVTTCRYYYYFFFSINFFFASYREACCRHERDGPFFLVIVFVRHRRTHVELTHRGLLFTVHWTRFIWTFSVRVHSVFDEPNFKPISHVRFSHYPRPPSTRSSRYVSFRFSRFTVYPCTGSDVRPSRYIVSCLKQMFFFFFISQKSKLVIHVSIYDARVHDCCTYTLGCLAHGYSEVTYLFIINMRFLFRHFPSLIPDSKWIGFTMT